MAEEASPNSSPKLQNPSLCNECGLNPWKYRCPGCSIRSCSLPCVNLHKKRTSCTGKRSHTEVVPLSQFDDKLLLSDYNLLEETKRVADSARRKSNGFVRNFRFNLPKKLRMLRNAANRRRIRFLLFPDGMSKREKNKSRYDKRKDSIFWTIELRFHGTDVALVHHGVDEHGSLLSLFGKHLAPGPWNHKLRPFCDVQLDDLKLFLRTNPRGSKSLFRKLDIRAPISSQFNDTMILEYPVIFVYLPSHGYDFEVETGRMPFIRNTVPFPTCDGMPSSNGTSYKEEEVEEGDDASDTRITDLMVCSKSESANVPSKTCLTKEVTRTNNAVHFTNKQIVEATDEGFRHKSCDKHHVALTTSPLESADAGFYFEQEVRDAYSDLIGEMNPDDFLCLDGVYNDDDDLGEGSWYKMVESKRIDTEKKSDCKLDELTGKYLGESRGNDCYKENLVSDLEETEGNESKEGRTGDPEEKLENFFFYNEDPFGEMELEEGEIPYFL